jgi:Papain family cysteine protease/Fibronectin type III domain
MSGSRAKAQARWLTTTLVILLLVVLAGHPNVTLGSTPERTYGDIPLDPATYQKYLQVMPDYMVEALPSAYDARDDGIVTPPKNQGACGSCWSFASVGAMESHLQKEYSFGLTDLSEQQILSCNTFGYDCSGGSSDAPRYWESDGPIYEACFPYQANDTIPCSNAAGCPRLDYRVTNWHTVASDQFKASLYYDGPSYWRFTVYSDFEGWWDSAPSGAVYVNGPGTTVEGGHAVLLIGWDDAKSAYLCKNSWGATGGPQADGTFWIAYSGHYHDLGFAMSNFDLQALIPPPNAPTGLTATAVSQHQINLSWTDNATNESGFKIEGSPFSPGSWTQIATVGANVTTYPNTGLASGTTYYYRVRAWNAAGDSAYSNEAHATTFAGSQYWAYLPIVVKSPGTPSGSIVNGDFEDGHEGWTEYSSHGWPIITTSFPGGVTPHGGTWAAWLGGDYNDISYLQQQVTVPTSNPYLAYYHWIASADICGYDYAGVLINGAVVHQYDLCSSQNTGGWVRHTVYLGVYAGQSVALQIRVETDSSYNSNLFVDDVTFAASAAASPAKPLAVDPASAAPRSGSH